MGYFLPFYPSNSLKNQNFKKMRKTHRDIIILHKCTKIHDHMLNCSWDMVRHICNYFSFWAIFCPFTPLTAQKSKFQKNEKKILEISSFYTCVPKVMIRWCTISQIWCATDGQRDGRADSQKEKVTYRGGCPPKN